MAQSNAAAIADLGFLTGRWQSEGFLIEFGTPHGTMLFGSMQAVENGVTTYWATFRFAREGDALACYPAQMGNPSGRYELTELSRDAAARVAFENGANPLHRRLVYSADAGSGTLTISIEGEREGGTFNQSWTLTRV